MCGRQTFLRFSPLDIFPLWMIPPPFPADIGHAPRAQFISVSCRRHETKEPNPECLKWLSGL